MSRAQATCARPTPPDYAPITIDDADENAKWETLLDNLARQGAYIDELQAALDCYEASQ